MKMPALILAAIAAFVPLASDAQERFLPDDIRATLGVRMWRTDWSTWYDEYEYRHAKDESPVVVVGSVRWKDFLVSGSYMVRQEFEFPLTTVPVKRNEYDVNLGYFIYPGLVATVGYKNIKYENAAYNWETKGFTVGLSANAPIAPMVSIYGNIAYGRPKIYDRNTFFNDTRSKYLLTEVGLAFPLGQLDNSLSSFVVTAGYRYQRVGAVPNFTSTEVFEYAQGPVIGISMSL
jgi:hypothetical protein